MVLITDGIADRLPVERIDEAASSSESGPNGFSRSGKRDARTSRTRSGQQRFTRVRRLEHGPRGW